MSPYNINKARFVVADGSINLPRSFKPFIKDSLSLLYEKNKHLLGCLFNNNTILNVDYPFIMFYLIILFLHIVRQLICRNVNKTKNNLHDNRSHNFY